VELKGKGDKVVDLKGERLISLVTHLPNPLLGVTEMNAYNSLKCLSTL